MNIMKCITLHFCREFIVLECISEVWHLNCLQCRNAETTVSYPYCNSFWNKSQVRVLRVYSQLQAKGASCEGRVLNFCSPTGIPNWDQSLETSLKSDPVIPTLPNLLQLEYLFLPLSVPLVLAASNWEVYYILMQSNSDTYIVCRIKDDDPDSWIMNTYVTLEYIHCIGNC